MPNANALAVDGALGPEPACLRLAHRHLGIRQPGAQGFAGDAYGSNTAGHHVGYVRLQIEMLTPVQPANAFTPRTPIVGTLFAMPAPLVRIQRPSTRIGRRHMRLAGAERRNQ